MDTDKVIKLLEDHIKKTYSPTCFRYQQCLDMLSLIKAKLAVCIKL